ncbi:MAG: HD domain-containing protein [Dehalococcoidia bacterium]|nr:HD domain-containing protein [Dehalococcoidia bacterium]
MPMEPGSDARTSAEEHDAFIAAEEVDDVELEPVRRADLLPYLSGAFDLAEAEDLGHACRVALVALGIVERLKLDAAARRRTLRAALLHDSGIAVRIEGGRLQGGAWVAHRFGFDEDVARVIAGTHERWDGRGHPEGRAMGEIPVESLAISAAHWASDQTDGMVNPLRARADLQRLGPDDAVAAVGREVADALRSVLKDDHLWASLWSDSLPRILGAAGAGDGRPSIRKLEHTAEVMGEVVDVGVRELGRSARVSALAGELGQCLGRPEGEVRALRVAGHLLDIGQLGISREITDKPSILSIEEMETMRRHPSLGARLLDGAPGLGPIPAWIEAHHERPDGRGYPAMLTVDELELAPRILAVADTYCALRAQRPYRGALSHQDALALIEAGGGRQYDVDVADVLPRAAAVWDRVPAPVDEPRLDRKGARAVS